MSDPTPNPADFLRSADVCRFLLKNLEAQFQIDGLNMPREEAKKHFTKRQILIAASGLLSDEAERITKP